MDKPADSQQTEGETDEISQPCGSNIITVSPDRDSKEPAEASDDSSSQQRSPGFISSLEEMGACLGRSLTETISRVTGIQRTAPPLKRFTLVIKKDYTTGSGDNVEDSMKMEFGSLENAKAYATANFPPGSGVSCEIIESTVTSQPPPQSNL